MLLYYSCHYIIVVKGEINIFKGKESGHQEVFWVGNIYLFEVNNRNTEKRYEICSKLTIKPPERCYWRRSGVFVNLNIFHTFF